MGQASIDPEVEMVQKHGELLAAYKQETRKVALARVRLGFDPGPICDLSPKPDPNPKPRPSPYRQCQCYPDPSLLNPPFSRAAVAVKLSANLHLSPLGPVLFPNAPSLDPT